MSYLSEALTNIPVELLSSPAGRSELTRFDPLMFAWVYLQHHLKDETTGDAVTLSEFHIALVEYASSWITNRVGMKQNRDCFIAPRGCGKSTWLFLILPLWASAHGHTKFIAAYSDSATQAEQHLETFKHELEFNELLRLDYPTLVVPMKRGNRNVSTSDNRRQIQQANGFIFSAKGMDSSSLGTKVGSQRPTLILLDDVEPAEGANYSALVKAQRLSVMRSNIFYQNLFARVVLVGTTVMAGSIIHNCMTSLSFQDEDNSWVKEENFNVHYFPAIITNDDGTERSLWPEKWALEALNEDRNTREFQLNMMNTPVGGDTPFWTSIPYAPDLEIYGSTILSIDPAVTDRKTSDYTGISIVSLNPEGTVLYVREAYGVRMSSAELREHVRALIDDYESIDRLLVETNQGGDLWKSVFGGLGVKYVPIHQTLKKEQRIEKAHLFYERGNVVHVKEMKQLEQQMLSFPNSVHDDVLDSVATAILRFAMGKKQTRVSRQFSYVSR